MGWTKYQLGLIGFLILTLLFSVGAAADTTSQKTLLLTGNLIEENIHISVDCYPQALPNDGRSQAEISVTLLNGDTPMPEGTIRAEIINGDGTLTFQELKTNDEGVAVFPFRSGLMSEAAKVSFSLVDQEDVQASLNIPLAPVTYLDVLLVEPAEYEAYLSRQASAAPIYVLTTEVFPDQLAADGGSLALITAHLDHVNGSVAAGVPLIAEIISGEGSLDMEQVATDSNGDFDLHFIAGYTPGTVSIAVTEPSTGLITTVDILLVEAGPARVQLFYLDPIANGMQLEGAILPADGVTGLPMTAVVTDLAGIPLAGIELDVSILEDGNGWLELIDPVSDISGEVKFIYHAGTGVGPVRLRAYVANGMNLEDSTSDMLMPF